MEPTLKSKKFEVALMHVGVNDLLNDRSQDSLSQGEHWEWGQKLKWKSERNETKIKLHCPIIAPVSINLMRNKFQFFLKRSLC